MKSLWFHWPFGRKGLPAAGSASDALTRVRLMRESHTWQSLGASRPAEARRRRIGEAARRIGIHRLIRGDRHASVGSRRSYLWLWFGLPIIVVICLWPSEPASQRTVRQSTFHSSSTLTSPLRSLPEGLALTYARQALSLRGLDAARWQPVEIHHGLSDKKEDVPQSAQYFMRSLVSDANSGFFFFQCDEYPDSLWSVAVTLKDNQVSCDVSEERMTSPRIDK